MAEIRNVFDIVCLSPEEKYEAFGVNNNGKNIEKVIINGNEFTDYKAFSFLWEKSYIREPVRSGNGSIGNLNAYATFLTPHLKIDFSVMSIDSYRKLMSLIYSSNEFLVTCYDVVNDKMTTNKMYFTTEEMPKLWTIVEAVNGNENAISLLGVQDYTVEMVGTNNTVETITVNYYLNSPNGTGATTPIGSFDIDIGSEILLGQDSNISDYLNDFQGYAFNKVWKLGSEENSPKYNDGDAFAITGAVIDTNSNSINFYAEWKPTGTYTLTYSYGLGEPKIDTTTMQEITSKQVVYGNPIGNLPTSTNSPSVEYGEGDNKKTYYPYTWKGWYKTPIIAENSEKLEPFIAYWQKSSTTIYQVYSPNKYTLYYYVDGEIYDSIALEYGTPIPMLNIIKSGYDFKGWQVNHNNKIVTSLTMPPLETKLTAIFEKRK
jgi:hypothetical protein